MGACGRTKTLRFWYNAEFTWFDQNETALFEATLKLYAFHVPQVAEEIALVLAKLHAHLDDLLLQHGCYLVDNGEGRIVVVAGVCVCVCV